MNMRKGISPVLATVIIIAVTLVIAVAFVSWTMGIWGSFGTTESLQIYQDSRLYDNGTLVLHVKNTGTATAIIKKIEVVGVGSNVGNIVNDTIAPGDEVTIEVTIQNSQAISAGATYQIKVYTEAGNVYTTIIRAEEA